MCPGEVGCCNGAASPLLHAIVNTQVHSHTHIDTNGKATVRSQCLLLPLTKSQAREDNSQPCGEVAGSCWCHLMSTPVPWASLSDTKAQGKCLTWHRKSEGRGFKHSHLCFGTRHGFRIKHKTMKKALF